VFSENAAFTAEESSAAGGVVLSGRRREPHSRLAT